MGKVTLREIVVKDRAHIRGNTGDDNLRFNLWGKYILKSLSYPVVWLLLKCGISANTVTAIGACVAVVGCLGIITGNYWGMVSGAILVNIWALIDYADGQVARWNGTSSNYGRFLDNICDIGIAGLLFLCLGIGAYHQTGENFWLVVGGWCSICYLFTMIISYNFERLITPQLTGFVSGLRVRWLPKNLVQIVGFNLQNITGLIMPALLLGTIFGYLNIVLVLWAMISTGGVCFMAYSMIRKAGAE